MKVHQNAAIINVSDLIVRFEDFTAVNGISFNVDYGEIFGFLGPNGAGKTTTIRALTTLLHPTSGSISIDGILISKDFTEARKCFGVVQQQFSLDKDLSVCDNIKYHGLLHKVPKDVRLSRMDNIVSMLGLEPFLDRDVINLSGGWKRKTAIACALIHDPDILFLDEPTAGLDTQSRHMLWDMVRQLNRVGKTIFLTTHYIEEAENLCDRVAILNHGDIVAIGTPQDLCDAIGHYVVECDDIDGIRKYEYFSDRISARERVNSLDKGCYPLVRKTTLEDVFLEFTGRTVSSDPVKAVRL